MLLCKHFGLTCVLHIHVPVQCKRNSQSQSPKGTRLFTLYNNNNYYYYHHYYLLPTTYCLLLTTSTTTTTPPTPTATATTTTTTTTTTTRFKQMFAIIHYAMETETLPLTFSQHHPTPQTTPLLVCHGRCQANKCNIANHIVWNGVSQSSLLLLAAGA